MDEKRLAELQALADAATEGPWVPKYLKTLYTNGEVEHHVKSQANGLNVASIRFASEGEEIGQDQEDRDVQFIAAARTAVPELVAEVRRQRDALRRIGMRMQRRDADHPASVNQVLSEVRDALGTEEFTRLPRPFDG